ncbi:hypothetical protein PGSY75_0106200 [Plasmodium gaboni]|uniref:EF-hand domain-containing protein n=1 Tax=Plasmodium gaboni TaxID=647221 RepID=A0A151LX18_9APIC|nr:hypothetical protein PGSY75_0106200 [Plasmodium gaboni]KYO03707.1 hypothetical protein PGSY75_0106200 [Plasmodium gaboni]
MENINGLNKYDHPNEAIKKMVDKIINKLNKTQKDSSERIYYSRKEMMKYFVEAQVIFEYYDVEKKGEIDITLFPKMARQLKQVYDIRDINNFKKEMKIKKIDKMDLQLFFTLLKRKILHSINNNNNNNSSFRQHFDILDMQKKQLLDVDELRTYLGLMGDKINKDDFNLLLKHNLINNPRINKDDIVLDENKEIKNISFNAYLDMLTCYKYI